MKRRNHWTQTLAGHVENLKSLYIFVTVLFMMGVIFGGIMVRFLDISQTEGLLSYLGHFFQGLAHDEIADTAITFQHALGGQLKTLGIMWILGISVIGIPLLCVYIFIKGLLIGFTVGFLVNQLSWGGLWFAFVAVVPHNLLAVPALIIVAVSGIYFSLYLVQNRLIKHRGTIYPQFVSYCLLVTCMAVVLLIAAGIEAYLSPLLMKGAIPDVT
jgi:stage II sporulation protein M